MKNTRQYWILGFTIVIIVFGWGLITWMEARDVEPVTPTAYQPRPTSLPIPAQGVPLSRYTKLMDGSLFWGIYPAVTPPVSFRSSLTLWGTIKGSTAIVSRDPSSNADTDVVKVGDVYEGEKILEIGKDYIRIRNSTGEGRVKM